MIPVPHPYHAASNILTSSEGIQLLIPLRTPYPTRNCVRSCDSCDSFSECFCDSKSQGSQGFALVAIVFPSYTRVKKRKSSIGPFVFSPCVIGKLPQTIVLIDFIRQYYLSYYRKTIATIANWLNLTVFRSSFPKGITTASEMAVATPGTDARKLTNLASLWWFHRFYSGELRERASVLPTPCPPTCSRLSATPPVKGPYERSNLLRAGATPETRQTFCSKYWVVGVVGVVAGGCHG